MKIFLYVEGKKDPKFEVTVYGVVKTFHRVDDTAVIKNRNIGASIIFASLYRILSYNR